MVKLTDELFDGVAARFRALGEPARLRILDALRGGELTVGGLEERTRLNQANLSKHLQLLHAHGFVTRRKAGLFVYYDLTGDDVFLLCDRMCGRLVPPAPRATRRSAGPSARRAAVGAARRRQRP